MIVDAGLNLGQDRLFGLGGPPARPEYVAVGTGGTAPAAGDTALQTEVGRKLANTITRSAAVITVKTHFGLPDGNGTLAEVGILNASTGGTLFARDAVSPAVVKDSSKEMLVEYTITAARG